MFKKLFLIIGFIVIASHADSQAVRVRAQSDGQGLMVKENGNCWVLMPGHLLGITGDFQVESSPEPSVLGQGRAYADFWTSMDFAIGSVDQISFNTACTQPLADVIQPTEKAGPRLRGNLRISEPGGSISQYPMSIVDTADHKTFVAEFLSSDDRPQQGVSGAFMFVEGAPIGMAIQTPDGANRLTFVRIEEIGFAVKRWLEHRARAVTIPQIQAEAKLDGALPLKLESFDTPSISPETGPENLATGEGAYHFDFTGSATLSFSIAEEDAIGVSRVKIVSEGQGAKPLSILVSVDANITASQHPTYFARKDMSPTGTFDTTTRAEKYARRVLILIESVQGDGPVRIDRVEVY